MHLCRKSYFVFQQNNYSADHGNTCFADYQPICDDLEGLMDPGDFVQTPEVSLELAFWKYGKFKNIWIIPVKSIWKFPQILASLERPLTLIYSLTKLISFSS